MTYVSSAIFLSIDLLVTRLAIVSIPPACFRFVDSVETRTANMMTAVNRPLACMSKCQPYAPLHELHEPIVMTRPKIWNRARAVRDNYTMIRDQFVLDTDYTATVCSQARHDWYASYPSLSVHTSDKAT